MDRYREKINSGIFIFITLFEDVGLESATTFYNGGNGAYL
jgi:hypothetical protein